MRYWAVIIFILLHICVSGLPDIINVPGDFRNIKEAIDKASLGDIIIIAAGEYKQNVTINKGIELRGAGSDKTKIIGSVIVENADPVKIEGFTIEGQGDNAHFGVWCSNSSLMIENNIIFGYHHGIGSESSKLVIKNNSVTRNFNVGIQFATSKSTLIEGNNIEKNVGTGIRIALSENNISITDNIISGNSVGIECVQSSPKIRKNLIEGNQIAIQSNQESNPDLGLDNDFGYNVFANNSTLIVNMNNRQSIQAKGNYWSNPIGPDISGFEGKVNYIPWFKADPLKTQTVELKRKLKVTWGIFKKGL
ncbi:DUF1565 domain-containing protein [Candidatus Poribacteria bacterium]|nr:DUF1565 domain-containing protein [Candidatus Poribacteria bacterium]